MDDKKYGDKSDKNNLSVHITIIYWCADLSERGIEVYFPLCEKKGTHAIHILIYTFTDICWFYIDVKHL